MCLGKIGIPNDDRSCSTHIWHLYRRQMAGNLKVLANDDSYVSPGHAAITPEWMRHQRSIQTPAEKSRKDADRSKHSFVRHDHNFRRRCLEDMDASQWQLRQLRMVIMTFTHNTRSNLRRQVGQNRMNYGSQTRTKKHPTPSMSTPAVSLVDDCR